MGVYFYFRVYIIEPYFVERNYQKMDKTRLEKELARIQKIEGTQEEIKSPQVPESDANKIPTASEVVGVEIKLSAQSEPPNVRKSWFSFLKIW